MPVVVFTVDFLAGFAPGIVSGQNGWVDSPDYAGLSSLIDADGVYTGGVDTGASLAAMLPAWDAARPITLEYEIEQIGPPGAAPPEIVTLELTDGAGAFVALNLTPADSPVSFQDDLGGSIDGAFVASAGVHTWSATYHPDDTTSLFFDGAAIVSNMAGITRASIGRLLFIATGQVGAPVHYRLRRITLYN